MAILWDLIRRNTMQMVAESTHSDRVAHICVGKLTIIVLDNGLSSGRRQAIFWTNTGKLLIRNKIQWNLDRNSYVSIH